MIRRLLEAHYFSHRENPSPEQVQFWLRELRTPELLAELAGRFEGEARQAARSRAAVDAVLTSGEASTISDALHDEERRERRRDEQYWEPLREELSRLRRRG